MDSLKDKTIVITGAGSGIGEGIAYYFLKCGSKLSLVDKNLENLEKVVSTCRSKQPDCQTRLSLNTQVISTVADITKSADRANIIENTIKVYGQIDVLVNNAGIVAMTLTTETTDETIDKLFDVNTKSHISLTKLAIPYLKMTKGNIVNTSSTASTNGFSCTGIYSITKAAIDMFTEVLAVELGPFGVRVNSVNPGIINTLLLRGILNEEEYENFIKDQHQYHPLGRIGQPEDVAKCVAFLASDMASFVSGQHLYADGGRHCLHVGDIRK